MSFVPLGRLIPTDWKHIEKYPYETVCPKTVAVAERTLRLPNFHERYNQKSESACVGFASSWMMSVLNKKLYDAIWLWEQAKHIDEWPWTNPGDNNGTSVRAAMDVLRTVGHVPVIRNKERKPFLEDGIHRNRWAVRVDQIRTAIVTGTPVVFGINWYTNFNSPEKIEGRYWIGHGIQGTYIGGHAVCIYAVSDRLQAVGIVNSWGKLYPPLVWMPYKTVETLLAEYAEAALVTDR